jgi:hypothetical protein
MGTGRGVEGAEARRPAGVRGGLAVLGLLGAVFVALALGPAPAWGESRPLSGRAAAAELRAVARLLADAHPALAAYEPQGAMMARAAALAAALHTQAEVHPLVYGRSLHALLAPIGDSHLAVALPLYADGGGEVSLLPVRVAPVAEGWVVDAGPPSVPVGALVLAIDGLPQAALAEALASLVPADGADPAVRLHSAAVDIPRYYALYRGAMPASYAVTIDDGDGPREVVLNGADRAASQRLRAERRTASWSAPAGPPPSAPTLGRSPAGVDLLAVPSLGQPDLAGWRAGVAAVLAGRAVDAPLILDLRGNSGGLPPNGHALLDALAPGGPHPEWAGIAGYLRATPRVRAGSLRWLAGRPEDRLAELPRAHGGGWAWPGDPSLAARPAPIRPTLAGPLVVLVDEGTNSAANGLALALKAARPDTLLVGRSLGGACDRHTGELPGLFVGAASGAAVLFSAVDVHHVHPPGCVPGRGLAPDVWVHPSQADVRAGTDPYLRAADAALRGPDHPGR